MSAKLRNRQANKPVFFGILTLVWGAVAVYYHSNVAGFGAVGTFMGFFGFSVLVSPLAYCIGFDDEQAVNRAGGAGLMICLVLGLERWFTPGIPALDVFRTGMLWLGPFVFALSVLINSSRYYQHGDVSKYVFKQVLAVVLFWALMMAGSVLQIEAMLNVGTAFLILYILEKPFEVPQQNLSSLAFTGLVVCLAIGGGVYWAQDHVDLVAKWLPALAR